MLSEFHVIKKVFKPLALIINVKLPYCNTEFTVLTRALTNQGTPIIGTTVKSS